jgi:hypothetical protein
MQMRQDGSKERSAGFRDGFDGEEQLEIDHAAQPCNIAAIYAVHVSRFRD